MKIKKLETWQERFEADRLISTAFLHHWSSEEAEKKRKEEAEKKEEVNELIYGLYNDDGLLCSAVDTKRMKVWFDGQLTMCGELEMVASLPEQRAAGGVRSLMNVILREFRDRGDLFALLYPFSSAFYRKFGFEVIAKSLQQSAPIDQFSCFSCSRKVRQVLTEDQVPEVRALYEEYIKDFNLAEVKSDAAWNYRGEGEFGAPDFFHPDTRKYTYLFYDERDTAVGYLTFTFVPGPEGPFIGDMNVTDIVYLDPETLRSIFGFIYGMRAKMRTVSLKLPTAVDLGALIPETAKAERTLTGNFMARTLDPGKVLEALTYPEEAGSFVIHMEDHFLTENTGSYAVSFDQGRAVSVELTDKAADLSVTEETFTQLAMGFVGLKTALYREGTKLCSNEKLLKNVFTEKPVMA